MIKDIFLIYWGLAKKGLSGRIRGIIEESSDENYVIA